MPDRWVLTAHGLSMIRSQVRAEKKAQMETRFLFIPYVSGLTGLIGTLIGLIAVLKKGGWH